MLSTDRIRPNKAVFLFLPQNWADGNRATPTKPPLTVLHPTYSTHNQIRASKIPLMQSAASQTSLHTAPQQNKAEPHPQTPAELSWMQNTHPAHGAGCSAPCTSPFPAGAGCHARAVTPQSGHPAPFLPQTGFHRDRQSLPSTKPQFRAPNTWQRPLDIFPRGLGT